MTKARRSSRAKTSTRASPPIRNNQDSKKKMISAFFVNTNRDDCKDNKGNHTKSEWIIFKAEWKMEVSRKKRCRMVGVTIVSLLLLSNILMKSFNICWPKKWVKLPRATYPPTIMGRFMDQFCKFHRAIGHDTDHCFVFKNIVQWLHW